MGHPPKRNKYRARTPQFSFRTRKIDGLPERDDAKTREEKERLVREFLENKNAKDQK